MDKKTQDKISKAFGCHLKLIREGKKIRTGDKISLRELERIAEVDHSQIHRIEKGVTSPSLLTLKALADSLGITMAELVTFDIDEINNDGN